MLNKIQDWINKSDIKVIYGRSIANKILIISELYRMNKEISLFKKFGVLSVVLPYYSNM